MNIYKYLYTRIFRIFIKGFFRDNAIICQLLGICSALAVTNKLENALTMGFSVISVLIFSSIIVSMLKNFIPYQFRIITYMIIISTFVIIIDLLLKAYFPIISKQLGPYVGLIITNCIIMGRAEAFAIKNTPLHSFFDALGNGFSYAYSLIFISAIREILAFGTLLNIQILSKNYTKCLVMAMAPGAFFVLAIYIWLFKIASKFKT